MLGSVLVGNLRHMRNMFISEFVLKLDIKDAYHSIKRRLVLDILKEKYNSENITDTF